MATERRIFYHWNTNTESGEQPEILTLKDSDTLKYLRKVLRLKPDDCLTLVNPEFQAKVTARIIDLDKEAGTIKPDWTTFIQPEKNLPKITLGIALIKEKRWEWMLQKVTELGITQIIPILSENVNIQQKEVGKKSKRWQDIVEAAALQSEGLFIPEISKPLSLTEFIEKHHHIDIKLSPLSRLETDAKYPALQIETNANQTICGLIGPEGGWTSEEQNTILNAGYTPISLSPRVLKTETACTALMSVVNQNYL